MGAVAMPSRDERSLKKIAQDCPGTGNSLPAWRHEGEGEVLWGEELWQQGVHLCG